MAHSLFLNRKMSTHWGTELVCRRRIKTIGRWILWAVLTLAVAGGFGAGYLLRVAYRDGCVQPGSIAEALTPRNMEWITHHPVRTCELFCEKDALVTTEMKPCTVTKVHRRRTVDESVVSNPTAVIKDTVSYLYGDLPTLKYTPRIKDKEIDISWNNTLVFKLPFKYTQTPTREGVPIEGECDTVMLDSFQGDFAEIRTAVESRTRLCVLQVPSVESTQDIQMGESPQSKLRLNLNKLGVWFSGGAISVNSHVFAGAVDSLKPILFPSAVRVAQHGCSRIGKEAIVTAALSKEMTHVAAISAGPLGNAISVVTGAKSETAESILTGKRWFSWARSGLGSIHATDWTVDVDTLLAAIAMQGKTVYSYVSSHDHWNNPLGTLAAHRSAQAQLPQPSKERLILHVGESAEHCGGHDVNPRFIAHIIKGSHTTLNDVEWGEGKVSGSPDAIPDAGVVDQWVAGSDKVVYRDWASGDEPASYDNRHESAKVSSGDKLIARVVGGAVFPGLEILILAIATVWLVVYVPMSVVRRRSSTAFISTNGGVNEYPL